MACSLKCQSRESQGEMEELLKTETAGGTREVLRVSGQWGLTTQLPMLMAALW